MILFIYIIAVGSLFIFLITYMVVVAHHDTVTEEVITHPHIPKAFDDFTIFFIADVHRRKVKHRTIEKIDTNVDAVFIGGDLIERGVSLDKMRDNIRTLQQLQAPIYFVWGNNDYEVSPKKMFHILQSEGVIVLEDTIDMIRRKEEHLNIIGFNYSFDHELEPLVDWQCVDSSYTILLTHKPSSFFTLNDLEQAKIDLVLAGHTHGGQIRFFGFGLYEKGGFQTYNNTPIFVTEGYGYTMLPFRLGTKSQCHLITLQHISNV